MPKDSIIPRGCSPLPFKCFKVKYITYNAERKSNLQKDKRPIISLPNALEQKDNIIFSPHRIFFSETTKFNEIGLKSWAMSVAKILK